jgi:uncharacterized membrane protein
MWTRKELKDKAKKALSLNYWKTVLVSLILMVLVGGAAGSVAGTGSRKNFDDRNSQTVETTQTETTGAETTGKDAEDFFAEKVSEFGLPPQAAVVIGVIAALVGLISVGLTIAINAFLINPFEVGCKKFFAKNLNQKAKVSEIAFAFDNNYLNVVKVEFLRDLYTILWSLLLIIPGIIKAYEYRMIPYILGDHPDMDAKEAFAKSKQLMRGQKWRSFVLDLSFIGWEILSVLTARILGIFYVTPYRCMTVAALYEKLEYGNLEVEGE